MATTNGWNNAILAADSTIALNAGTNGVDISTDAAAATVNIATGAAAKVATLGSTNGVSSLALKYGTADFSLASATGNVIVAQDTGEVTKPLQPAFLAYLSVKVDNVTGDGTAYTVVCDTEVFDQNSDYNNATGVFTAPVTGRYLFCCAVQVSSIAAGNTGGTLTLVTTKRNYVGANQNTYNVSTGGYCEMPITYIADMDAGDTATISVAIYGGAKIVDVEGGGGTLVTLFSGSLLC